MIQKIIFFLLTIAVTFSSFYALPVLAEDTEDNNPTLCTLEYAPICGMDEKTYPNSCAAEVAGVEISYNGECKNINIAANQQEETSAINFTGMLVEIGSTDIPTAIIIRPNNGNGDDYTVNINENSILGERRDQTTNLSDWIPGDQIKVIGKLNENTNVVDASILINLSIKITAHRGANGWITKIDKDNNKITYQWQEREYIFNYNDQTRFVAALKNPASVDDLAVGDRIRGRLLMREGELPLAQIIVVLRRGQTLFMKIRTFTPRATLVRLDSAVVPTTIQVRIDKTPGLRNNDVNNLIGAEGKLVTVNVTEDTRLVRKFFGKTTLAEFSVGDQLRIVGRVNDDGTIDAKLIKNDSIWQTSTTGHAGVVTEINTNENYLMVNWTPIKYLPQSRLKDLLKSAKEMMSAQANTSATIINRSNNVGTDTNKNQVAQKTLREKLKNRIEQLQAKTKEKVGQFTRAVKQKKVVIDRIKNETVKLKDLITRAPVQSIRVDINDDTRITVGINTNASINDIKIGDKVRIRGIKHAKLPIIEAKTIVVVNSLPEVEETLTTNLDDINEVVSEIIVEGDSSNALTDDTTTETEEEIITTETEEESATASSL